MKNLFGNQRSAIAPRKVLLPAVTGAMAIMSVLQTSAAPAYHSPRGRETFGRYSSRTETAYNSAPKIFASTRVGFAESSLTETSDVTSAMEPKAIVPPRAVRLMWKYPPNQQTPDLVFKVYQHTNPAVPLRQWPVITNVPGNLRSVRVLMTRPQAFFVLTASNRFGESGFARR